MSQMPLKRWYHYIRRRKPLRNYRTSGNGTVIFTAHGVSPEIREIAKRKGLVSIDATCPDVTVTHDLIAEKSAEGYDIIYIGKKGHPEPEGAIGVAPDHVHLVRSSVDIEH